MAAGDAPQVADDRTTRLMLDIRALGRLPQLKRSKDAAQTAERNLAKRLGKARAAGHLTAEHEAELTAMDVEQPAGDAPQLARDQTTCLMQDIRAFGRIPETKSGKDAAQTAERNLAQRLRKAKKSRPPHRRA